ncbi:hypothetical protein M758_4G184200 [Ceratodon purpureus]|nr:hypothetical protein M758_4G184200 [Ceratodon purpureus]
MQGPKTRLDQIFPSRKPNNATPELDTPSTRKKKENPNEVSPSKKATLESFIVRSKSASNHSIAPDASGFGDKQDGFNGYVRQSTWPKTSGVSGRSDGTNSTDSWLQGCRPNVSKFVPKRLLGPEIGTNNFSTTRNPKTVNGSSQEGSPYSSPFSSQSKAVADVSPASRKAKGETIEKGHSQFADDFLSMCVSGIPKKSQPCEPLSVIGVSNKKRAIGNADYEKSKKQRHIDGLEDYVISCTPHFLPADLSGNDEDKFREELGSLKEEKSVGLLKSFKEQSIRRGLSGLPSIFTTKEFAQLELTPGGGVDPHSGADADLMYGVHHIGGEDAPSPNLSNGPVSCSNPADVAGIGNKSSLSADLTEKGSFQFVSHEGGAMLPPTSKTPEEARPRRSFTTGRRTPKSRSRSRSKGVDEVLCSTPYSRNSMKSDRRSLSGGKTRGSWQYHSSMFSPGDSFWDEAIEAADGLFVSNVNGIPPKQSSIGRSILSSAERTASAVDGEIYNHVGEGAGTGVLPEDVGTNVGRCSDTSGLRCPANISAVNSEGMTNTDLVFNRRFDELDSSPLPVRRFSFTRQSGSPSKNVVKSEIEEIVKVSPTRIQLPVGSVLQEPLDTKSIFSMNQVSTAAIVDINGVSKELHEIQMDTGLLLEAVPPTDATSTFLEVVSRTPFAIAEPVPHTNLSAGDIPERSDSIKTEAVVPIEEADEHASVSRSLKNTSLELSDWLPPEACAMYASKGVKRLYPWQVECLQQDGVLEGRSLVYCASTSAGKSLVAEVLMLRRILSTGKKALLVLPYVALCSEKADHLDAILEPLGKRVRGFYGSQGGSSLTKDTSVAVCTIEKANVLVNKLLEEGRLSELAILVIDELHMVGDRDRGYLLELLLTKLRYAAGGGECATAEGSPKDDRNSSSSWNADLQIVGMSATMPNVSDVATWLEAALYQTEFRPVPLEELMKVGHTIYNKKMEVVRSIKKSADLGGKDPDHLVELCHEVVSEGHSVLVFCSSRKGCETSARHISKFLPPFEVIHKDNMNGPKDGNSAVEELRRCPAGLDLVLADTLPAGVAYHHAGLTAEEREVVETCFKSGVVRVLVATSTLAAGVNLPARRVIFRQPKIGRDFLDVTRYRQMAGRAGRAGIDTKGESVLICKPEEVKRMIGMMGQDCKALQSCLADDKNGMMRALLEVVAGGVVQSAADVQRYVRCTLLNATQPFEDVVKAAQDSLRWLCHKQLVEWDKTSRLYTSTPLGRAAFSSSLSPEESLVVYEDLAKAREGFVLASDLHLLYEVTPTYVDLEPDWGVYYSRFMELSPIDQAVGNRVGVVEPFLLRMAHGAPVVQGGNGRPRVGKFTKGKVSPPFQRNKLNSPGGVQLSVEQMLRVCKRFYVALMLSKLVQEVPLMEICESFKVPRGTVQGLQDSAGRFSGMVKAFCERLGWSDMEGLFSKFQKRVLFGVKSELVDLTEIPFVKAARARSLFKSGLRSVHAIAEATLPEIVKALYGNISWAGPGDKSNRGQQFLQMGIARKIKNGARRLALDRAEEARAAAFSAYEALGVKVPAALALPMVGTLDEDDAQVAPAISFPSMMAALSVGVELKTAEVPAGSETKTQLASEIDEESDMLLQRLESIPSFRDHKPTSSAPAADKSMLGKTADNIDSDMAPHHPVLEKSTEISLQPVGEACHEVQIPKCKEDGSAKGSLFTGSLLAQQEFAVDEPVDDYYMLPTRGPLDVDKLVGGFDEFVTKWQGVDEFAFDVHFKNQKGGVPELFEMMGVAVCWKDSPVYYVNLSTVYKSSQQLASSKNCSDEKTVIREAETALIESQARWRTVGTMLSNTGVRKIAWDLKIQLQALNNPCLHAQSTKPMAETECSLLDAKTKDGQIIALPSLKLQGPVIDIRVAAWLLWPDEESARPLTLEQEVKKRLAGEIAAAAGRAGRWTNQMGCVAHNGCCRRAAQVWVLHCAFWKLLVAEGLHEALLQLEMPLVKVLADMETSGLAVDMRVCRKAQSLLHRKLRELEVLAERLAGMSFSLSAPAEVAHVLYRHLKLPVPPGSKGKHHPSTDKQALDFLRNHHPIADVVKEHRSLSKLLHSTLGSVIAWAKSPEPCFGSQARVLRGDIFTIFGHWLQTSTATGRLSMEDPNLQCVEHAVSFTIEGESSSDGGQERENDVVEVNARQAFVPSQEGWVLLSADYSQIEVRLMAHFSGDPTLVSLLSQPNGDLFRLLAAQWAGVTECKVSEKQREHTKRLVYGILYGMGVNTLSEHLQCPLADAQDMLERFKTTFPSVTAWLNQAVHSCRQKGCIKTLSGRKRYLDKINTGNWGEQAKAERQAVNSICQGSAADLIKLAMIKVHDAISASARSDEQSIHQGSSSSHFQGSCRLLLQIHDELVMEVDKRVLKDVAQMLRSSMEGATALRVPLRAKLQVGTSWGSLQPYTEDLTSAN